MFPCGAQITESMQRKWPPTCGWTYHVCCLPVGNGRGVCTVIWIPSRDSCDIKTPALLHLPSGHWWQPSFKLSLVTIAPNPFFLFQPLSVPSAGTSLRAANIFPAVCNCLCLISSRSLIFLFFFWAAKVLLFITLCPRDLLKEGVGYSCFFF